MLSNELGSLAGVSVRTLRHYHQVGVLVEPPRTANGYRQYDVHDLIRVLRIKRLAALGIPLEKMPALLVDEGDDDADSPRQLLDQLDDELTAEIARLHHQKRLLAQLRKQRTPPDLPPELAPFLSHVSTASPSPHITKLDRDQSVLLAHFVGETGLPFVSEIYEKLDDPAISSTSTTLNARFESLGSDAPQSEIDALIDDVVESFASMIVNFDTNLPSELQGSFEVFEEHVFELFNDSQRQVIVAVSQRIEGSGLTPDRESPVS